MILPLAEFVGPLQQGVGSTCFGKLGWRLMQAVMEGEVRHLAGEHHQQHEGRRTHRWVMKNGCCVLTGRRCGSGDPDRAPPLRDSAWAATSLFQRRGPMKLGVWSGAFDMHNGAVVKGFQIGYGIEKSAVRENFNLASREKFKE
jgi:hypothetical protein